MHNPFAIKSSRVLVGENLVPQILDIQQGRIARLRGYDESGLEPLNFGDAVVMPGRIDPHVHINEPGRTNWEGFVSATKAAAADGATLLVDMPLNSSPVTTNPESLQLKLDAAAHSLWVDVGFYGGLVPENALGLSSLLESGVLGIKAFTIDSGIEEFPAVEQQHLEGAMEAVTSAGLPLLVHAELQGDLPPFEKSSRRYRDYLESRPPSMEVAAIEMMIDLCRRYKTRVHIVHVACAEAIPLIARAKEEGLPITAETCPHYLYFAAEEVVDGNVLLKCAPPIRSQENQEQLWQALESGVLDFIASDHSPSPPEVKHLEEGDFSNAWGGIAGLQYSLPAVWKKARERQISLAQLSEWFSGRPAKLLGMESERGAIRAGYLADLLVWQPEETFVATAKDCWHRHKCSPYHGEELSGKVVATYVRGHEVYRAGRHSQEPIGEVVLQG